MFRDGNDSVGVSEERVLRPKTAVVACLRESVCLVTAAQLCYIDSFAFGVWLSLVERLVRDQEVASSNLVTPTLFNFKPIRDLDYLPVFGSAAFPNRVSGYIPACAATRYGRLRTMPRLAQSVPKYRKHKASGQAFVELNGRRHYLGPHGSKTSRDEYDRRIGEWLQNGRATKPVNGESGSLLVVELIAAYLNFAKCYYRKDGRLTSEYTAVLHAMSPLKQLYGRKPVSEFGPIALQTVTAQMVANGWA